MKRVAPADSFYRLGLSWMPLKHWRNSARSFLRHIVSLSVSATQTTEGELRCSGSGRVTVNPDRQSGMYGPPPFCKRRMRMTELASARMYSAFIGVANSWPEWDALRSSFFNNAAFEGIFGYRSSRERRDRPLCHLIQFASKPGRNLQTQISRRRWSADVGIQRQRFPSLALCARRHVQAIRLRSHVVLWAGDKPLL